MITVWLGTLIGWQHFGQVRLAGAQATVSDHDQSRVVIVDRAGALQAQVKADSHKHEGQGPEQGPGERLPTPPSATLIRMVLPSVGGPCARASLSGPVTHAPRGPAIARRVKQPRTRQPPGQGVREVVAGLGLALDRRCHVDAASQLLPGQESRKTCPCGQSPQGCWYR